MTVKGLIRLAIGILLAALILFNVAPLAGIPRAQMFPPPFAYKGATQTTKGRITATASHPTTNPLKVSEGEIMNYVTYEFYAPCAPLLAAPCQKPKQMYTGEVNIATADYAKYKDKVGMVVPVRYEKTYPVINGMDTPDGGRSDSPGSALASSWILWALVTVALGYVLSGALERVMLRESY